MRPRALTWIVLAIATGAAARRWLDVVEVRGRSMAPTLLPGDRLGREEDLAAEFGVAELTVFVQVILGVGLVAVVAMPVAAQDEAFVRRFGLTRSSRLVKRGFDRLATPFENCLLGLTSRGSRNSESHAGGAASTAIPANSRRSRSTASWLETERSWGSQVTGPDSRRTIPDGFRARIVIATPRAWLKRVAAALPVRARRLHRSRLRDRARPLTAHGTGGAPGLTALRSRNA
jgi:hypothetical protein